MAVGQIVHALSVDGVRHIDHVWEEVQAQRRLGLFGVHKIAAPVPALRLGIKELAHGAVPVHHAKDTRELIALAELLHGAFEHPEVAMIVEDDLFAEAIVPQAEHHIDEHFSRHILTDGHSAGHTVVVVGVRTKVERRQR